MFQGKERIEISRPTERVFAFLADLENDAQWMKILASSRRTSDGRGPGATYERTYSGPLGRGQITRVRVEEFEAPRRLAIALDAGAGTGRITYDLEGMGPATELTMTTVLEHKGLAGRLMPLVAPMMRRADRRALQELKALLEATS